MTHNSCHGLPESQGRDATAERRASRRCVRRHLGASSRRQVAVADRVVQTARRAVHGCRPIGARGAAKVSRASGRDPVPGVRRRRVPGLARVLSASGRRCPASGVAGTRRPRRTALPDRGRPRHRERPAELARQPGPHAEPRSERLQPAHDAWCRPRRGRAALRPGGRSLCRPSPAGGLPGPSISAVLAGRPRLDVCALGWHAPVLGTGVWVRRGSRQRRRRVGAGPGRSLARRTPPAPTGRDTSGRGASPRARRHRRGRQPGERDRRSDRSSGVQHVATPGDADGHGLRAPRNTLRKQPAIRQAQSLSPRRSVSPVLVPRRGPSPCGAGGGTPRNPAWLLAPSPRWTRSPGLGGALPRRGALVASRRHGIGKPGPLGAGATLLARQRPRTRCRRAFRR